MDTYQTITNISTSLFKDKGSKHFGYAIPVEKESSVKKALEKLHHQHPKANHICYAYKLDLKGNKTRANDDGEPSGSAGKPILGQIEKYKLCFVLIAVVRYFGGTKLGVSGLQKAYKTAAELAILENIIITKDVTCTISFAFPYALQGEIDYYLKQNQGIVVNKSFDKSVFYTCLIPNKNILIVKEYLDNKQEIEVILDN